MQRYRKLISLLLVLVLTLSLCPMSFAADDADFEEVFEAVFEESELIEADEVETTPVESENPDAAPEEGEEPENPDAAEEDAEGEESEEKDTEEEEDAEEDAEEEEKLFPGMPESYALSVEEMDSKQRLNTYGVVDELERAVPGVDYIDGEVFFLADTLEYAQMVADAYGAVLATYDSGVATLILNGAGVIDAVAAAADMNSNLPAVEANYILDIDPVVEAESDEVSTNAYRDDTGVSVKGSWKTWFESTGNPDKFLSDPSAYTGAYQYMHDIVNTYEAWGITKGDSVTVAVVDSGVASHPDLNTNVIARESVNSSWGDLQSAHGTHVAGIVAAQMGNGKGGAGIAPDADIYSVRVFQNNSGSTDNIIRGVNKVIEAKRSNSSIKVMNMSLGGYGYSAAYERVIANAISAGITVVAAMGNDGTNIKSYPAAFNIPGLIAVQSSTAANTMSSFSNYGAWADVSAPGSNILSTSLGSGYEYMSGTSMAAPVVSGVCALYLSVYPNATPAQVEKAVKKAVNKGIVDASKLFANENAAPTITTTAELGRSKTLPYGSAIIIESTNSAETLIYTLDGKAPSVRNGVVTGNVVEDGYAYIPLTAKNGFTVGKNVTVRAAAVNGFGVVGKAVSLTFKIDYAAPEYVEVTSSTTRLMAGRSFNFAAAVYPAQANQKLEWVITLNDGCPGTKIDKTRGTLRTGAKDNGSVIIEARSADYPNVRSIKIIVEIGSITLTKKITLQADGQTVKNLPLFVNSTSSSDPVLLTATAYKPTSAKANSPLEPIYDDSFTWTTSNPKVAVVDSSGTVYPIGNGSATITCTAKDGSNVRATMPVRVQSAADEIAISGYSNIAAGKSAAYTVSILPKTATYKTVSWSLIGAPSGVTINARGTVTVAKTVPEGTRFRIGAYSVLGVYDEKEITVSSGFTNVKIIGNDLTFAGLRKTARDGSLTEVTLFSTAALDYTDERSYYNTYSSIQLGLLATPVSEVQWSSSNPKVAVVDESGHVTAVSAGRARITAKAMDAGRKQHAINVVVVNPASSISVQTLMPVSNARWTPILVSGKTARNTAVLGDAHGAPTIKAVTWDYIVVAIDSSNNREDVTDFAKAKKLFTISKTSGQLTAARNAYSELWYYTGDGYSFYVCAIARTTDGSGLSAGYDYELRGVPMTKLFVRYGNKDYTSLRAPFTMKKGGYIWSLPVFCTYGTGSSYYSYEWTVKSSNPNVAGAVMDRDQEYGNPLVTIISGEKAGTATITLTSTDGSNKRVTITVTVK